MLGQKGRAPIGVRWVDVDKGFGVYRSRLVAKDFKPRSKINDKEGLFAATPPPELVKILFMKVLTPAEPTFTPLCLTRSSWSSLPETEGRDVREADVYTLRHVYCSKQLRKGIQQDIGRSWVPSWTGDSCSFLSSDTRHQGHRAR